MSVIVKLDVEGLENRNEYLSMHPDWLSGEQNKGVLLTELIKSIQNNEMIRVGDVHEYAYVNASYVRRFWFEETAF